MSTTQVLSKRSGLSALRQTPASLVAIALLAPVSLLVLYLWTTPSGPASGTTLGRGLIFLAAWLLMSAAMMLPSAMPLLAALARVARGHDARHQLPALAALAYLAVWGSVGVAAWMTSAAAERYLLPWASARLVAAIAGAALVLAGAYGLSPLAGACLRACRRPFGFLARHWRGGSRARLQAARIGAAYGVSCVGCCVPMIGVMFVVGMANVAVVVAMGLVMAIMKSSAAGTRVAQLLSVALILAGLVTGIGWLPVSSGHHH
jgi:predicted metal-binding membrane protein